MSQATDLIHSTVQKVVAQQQIQSQDVYGQMYAAPNTFGGVPYWILAVAGIGALVAIIVFIE